MYCLHFKRKCSDGDAATQEQNELTESTPASVAGAASESRHMAFHVISTFDRLVALSWQVDNLGGCTSHTDRCRKSPSDFITGERFDRRQERTANRQGELVMTPLDWKWRPEMGKLVLHRIHNSGLVRIYIIHVP